MLIISNGLDLGVNLENVFDNYIVKHHRISDLIILDALDDEDHEHHNHGEHGPYLWTSPRNLTVISTALRMVLYDQFREQ